jgi:hypothetical protein
MNSRISETVACSPWINELETQVRCRLSGRVRDLQLLRQENGLVLKGHCRTYYAKQLAQHAVMEATELPILANEIEVCCQRSYIAG